MPGETVAARRYVLRDLLVFVDTPGFQNARKMLAEIEASPAAPGRLDPFRAFVARHRDDPAFDAECRLFAPVLEGAGIVYAVDAARPLRDLHRAEMELLRRTRAPRLAVLNRVGGDDCATVWKGPLEGAARPALQPGNRSWMRPSVP